MTRPRHRLTNHAKVFILSLVSGLPALAFMIHTIYRENYSTLAVYTIAVVVIVVYAYCLASIYRLVVRPWQIMANIVAALKERDYTLRVRYPNIEDPMGLSFEELNSLANYLQSQRLDMMETHELLFKILQEVEAAVFCFDQDENLVMANQYARNLYRCGKSEPLTGTATELGLKDYIGSNLHTAYEISFPARKSRWLVKRSPYRENGLPHIMLLIADLQGPLREEELDAWKKLIRVLGHELNNSMTPLKSMANSLTRILRRDPLPDDWKDDMSEGLTVIGRRVDGLSRFVQGYSQLARMPVPKKSPFHLRDLIERTVRFDPRFDIKLLKSQDCLLKGDEGQLEQVVVNLLKNATEACVDSGGRVQVSWKAGEKEVAILITDEGQGLASEENVFVPFFSTKKEGSGIGLALSRQIIEAHGGSITLENRKDRSGCTATLILPIGLE